ncbi:MAG: hypothetical protein KF812_05665 [Fimbriimonadaceae bacterium]|nr:hypothetical protein [Fimbriimonadaceae bacterium]
MKRFLVAIHHRDDYDPAIAEDESMHRNIDRLNKEMVAAGVRIFVGGLHRAIEAKSIQTDQSGHLSVTGCPYLRTDEHMAGFWVLECADMDDALEWGKKAAFACLAPVEVREFH